MSHSIRIRSSLDLESLRRYVREQVLPRTANWDSQEEFPVEVFHELHRQGYLTAFVPESQGGLGATTLDMMTIGRELSYASRGLACSLAGHMLSLLPILLFGSDALRSRVVSRVLQNPELGSFCFTEPDAGSDILRIQTRARLVPGGYSLKGSKCFITNSHHASHFVVMAKLEGVEDARKAITAFYVPAGAAGLSFGGAISKLGFRDSNTADVFLDEVFVPADHVLGGEGKGLSVALRSLQRSRTYFAGAAVGLCERARDLLEGFLANRVHYGMPLLDQPQIRGQIAQLETEVRALWLLGCEAAQAWEEENAAMIQSSMAKLYSGQVAMRYASAAVELFGAWGCTSEYEVSRLFRDAKFFEIVEGPTFVQHVMIAKELFRKSAPVRDLRKAG